VSQTWDEIQRLNENIRRGLQTDGLIGKEDTVVTACVRRDLTPAQKRDKRFYDDDSILVFQRKTGGIGRGETGRLWDITGTHLLVEVGGRIRSVSFSQLEHFHVCRPKELKLAAGDRLQLKGNGETGTGRNLANGELVTVNLSSFLRKRKSLICKVPASDHLLQLAIRPRGRLGKKLQQIQLGQHVVKVFGHPCHHCFEVLAFQF
jgi:hypothetical protein